MLMNFKCNNHVKSFCREDALAEKEYGQLSERPVNIPDGEYTFTYTYPLSCNAHFKHEVNSAMSIIDVLLLAKSDYERIYKEEDETDGDPGMIPGMLNRARSSGPYGIWGHVLEDLYFEGVTVDTDAKTVKLDMGS